MDDMIAEFNQTYPNVKVELTSYNNNSDGNLAVDAALIAGEIDVLASFGLGQRLSPLGKQPVHGADRLH